MARFIKNLYLFVFLQLEFDVEQCATGVATNECTNTRRSHTSIPTGGDVVYGVAHLHNGGIGSVLYGEVN